MTTFASKGHHDGLLTGLVCVPNVSESQPPGVIVCTVGLLCCLMCTWMTHGNRKMEEFHTWGTLAWFWKQGLEEHWKMYITLLLWLLRHSFLFWKQMIFYNMKKSCSWKPFLSFQVRAKMTITLWMLLDFLSYLCHISGRYVQKVDIVTGTHTSHNGSHLVGVECKKICVLTFQCTFKNLWWWNFFLLLLSPSLLNHFVIFEVPRLTGMLMKSSSMQKFAWFLSTSNISNIAL